MAKPETMIPGVRQNETESKLDLSQTLISDSTPNTRVPGKHPVGLSCLSSSSASSSSSRVNRFTDPMRITIDYRICMHV